MEFSKRNRKHVLRVSIELHVYKHKWKFGSMINAVGTQAAGKCFVSPQLFRVLCMYQLHLNVNLTYLYISLKIKQIHPLPVASI